jgi:Ser/Thr protein kinase RdoA (MazF antagonist)
MVDGSMTPAWAPVIAAQFSLGSDPVLSDAPVARGEQGQVWLLQTSSGRWAVKEAFRPITEPDIRYAAGFQTAAREAGVPTPRLVPDRTGNLIAHLGSAQVRVSEWVDLLRPDIYLDPATVGRIVAGIHRVEFAVNAPLDPWFAEPVGRDRWNQLGRELREAGAPFAEQFAAMSDEFAAMDEWVQPPGVVQTCHRDLWADNLRPTASGGMCVIDWENCGLADPGQELSGVLFEFWGGEPDRARELYREYRRCGGPGRVDSRGSFSMTVAQLGHIAEISCRAWLDPSEPEEERRRQVGRVAECVDEPLTLAVIDELLEAVG